MDKRTNSIYQIFSDEDEGTSLGMSGRDHRFSKHPQGRPKHTNREGQREEVQVPEQSDEAGQRKKR